MRLKPLNRNLKIAVLLPAYKRNEYTERCIESLRESGEIFELFVKSDLPLRKAILEFVAETRHEYDIIAKIDNDCLVPPYWLTNIIGVMDKYNIDIASPDVTPSHAAHKHGTVVEGAPYLDTKIIGGLWVMRTEVLEGMIFTDYDVTGLTGAIAFLRQIVNEKNPKLAWVPEVIVQDIGHWSGEHPDHIKTKEHEEYSREVGRDVAWTA